MTAIPPARTSIPITAAGIVVPDAAEAILQYIQWAPGTIQRYDGLAGSSAVITPELVRATRVIHSRISEVQLRWFVEQGRTAPWSRLNASYEFANCDPNFVGGLYDDLCAVWYHFVDNRPAGVGPTKVNKVLHLMNPTAVPIYDSVLELRYRAEARRLAPAVLRSRGGLRTSTDDFGWEPFRLDLVAARSSFMAIREQVATDPRVIVDFRGVPIQQWAAVHLSDLRLMDILVWFLGRGL